jgi:hypothetical protein
LIDKDRETFVIEDDINERYVAALILYSETKGIEIFEAHDDVSAFLDAYELDVDRTDMPYKKSDKEKFH